MHLLAPRIAASIYSPHQLGPVPRPPRETTCKSSATIPVRMLSFRTVLASGGISGNRLRSRRNANRTATCGYPIAR